MKNNIIIFDLDGTLLNTTEGLILSIDYAINFCNLPKLSYEEKLLFIGPPIEKSFKNKYNMTDENALYVASVFRDSYKNKNLFKAKVYDGIIELLESLKKDGNKLAIATNKRESYTLKLIEYFGLTDFFDVIHGTDENGKLNKTDIINLCISELKKEDEKSIMIGDTMGDYKASKEAGIDFIGVTYGFGFKENTEGVVLADIVELSEILKGGKQK